VIEVLVETRISIETIVNVLNYDCVDTVAHWQVEPDRFDLDVADTGDVTTLRDQLVGHLPRLHSSCRIKSFAARFDN